MLTPDRAGPGSSRHNVLACVILTHSAAVVQEELLKQHEVLAASQQESIDGRASHLMTKVLPTVIAQAKIDAMREELAGKGDATVTAQWDELKEQAGNEAREKAEAQAAEAAEAAEAAAAAAAEAEEGAEPAEAVAAPAVDVEAIVAEAIAKVEKPAVPEISDTDVLNALLEADPALKDSIVSMMAFQELGSSSWVNDERFEAELAPAAE